MKGKLPGGKKNPQQINLSEGDLEESSAEPRWNFLCEYSCTLDYSAFRGAVSESNQNKKYLVA